MPVRPWLVGKGERAAKGKATKPEITEGSCPARLSCKGIKLNPSKQVGETCWVAVSLTDETLFTLAARKLREPTQARMQTPRLEAQTLAFVANDVKH